MKHPSPKTIRDNQRVKAKSEGVKDYFTQTFFLQKVAVKATSGFSEGEDIPSSGLGKGFRSVGKYLRRCEERGFGALGYTILEVRKVVLERQEGMSKVDDKTFDTHYIRNIEVWFDLATRVLRKTMSHYYHLQLAIASPSIIRNMYC